MNTYGATIRIEVYGSNVNYDAIREALGHRVDSDDDAGNGRYITVGALHLADAVDIINGLGYQTDEDQ